MTKSFLTSGAKPEMAGKDEVTLPPILVDWNTLEKLEMGCQKLGLNKCKSGNETRNRDVTRRGGWVLLLVA